MASSLTGWLAAWSDVAILGFAKTSGRGNSLKVSWGGAWAYPHPLAAAVWRKCQNKGVLECAHSAVDAMPVGVAGLRPSALEGA